MKKEQVYMLKAALNCLETNIPDDKVVEVLEYAAENHVLGLMYSYVDMSKLEKKYTEHLKISRVYNYRCNILQKRKLIELKKLTGKEIKFVPIKGYDFARRLYNHFGERESGDIDILVDRNVMFDIFNALKSEGYSCLGKKEEIYDEYSRVEFDRAIKSSLDRYHDPLTLYAHNKPTLEIHANDYFPGLTVKKIYSDASPIYNDIELPFINDIDNIIISGWHFYHHFNEQVPNEAYVIERHSHIKGIADFYRAIMVCRNKKINVLQIAQRSKGTDSLHLMLFSLKKLTELLSMVDAPINDYLKKMLEIFNKMYSSCDRQNYRHLDQIWNFGDCKVNCWEWILNTQKYKTIIETQIKKFRQENQMRCVYFAEQYNKRNNTVYMNTQEKDRLNSYIYICYMV